MLPKCSRDRTLGMECGHPPFCFSRSEQLSIASSTRAFHLKTTQACSKKGPSRSSLAQL